MERKTFEEATAKLVLMQNIAVNKNEVVEEAKNAFELSEKESLEAHHKASFFSYTERKPLEEAIAKMVAIQNIVVNKKEAFELAKKEFFEAQHNLRMIKLEIEAIKVKGQFEATFLRFPHIAEQIFEFLDVQSLSECQEVSKCWQKFISETKYFFRQLENYTSIPRSILQESLKDYDFQTIQKLAHCASISHKKAVEACIQFKTPQPLEPKGSTLFYYLLSEGKMNKTQYLLAKLMLLNKMNTSTAMLDSLDNLEADGFRYAVAKFMTGARNRKFWKAYTTFKEIVLISQGKFGSLWNWIPILLVAVAQNHLALCRLIFEQIEDIQSLRKWVKIVLQDAISFGHSDMVKFFVEEIPGIDLLAEKNESPLSILDMYLLSGKLGH